MLLILITNYGECYYSMVYIIFRGLDQGKGKIQKSKKLFREDIINQTRTTKNYVHHKLYIVVIYGDLVHFHSKLKGYIYQ